MAKIVFSKNFEHLVGSVYSVFKDENELILSNVNQDFFTVVEINNQDYKDIILFKKRIINYVNGIVNYENITSDLYKNKEDLQKLISYHITSIENLLKDKPNHYNYSKLQAYKNSLINFNYDNLEYPMTKTYQEYLDNSGIEVINTAYLI